MSVCLVGWGGRPPRGWGEFAQPKPAGPEILSSGFGWFWVDFGWMGGWVDPPPVGVFLKKTGGVGLGLGKAPPPGQGYVLFLKRMTIWIIRIGPGPQI